jgi:hypothetical protein
MQVFKADEASASSLLRWLLEDIKKNIGKDQISIRLMNESEWEVRNEVVTVCL